MAYFSNGTEGMIYESQYCENCINYREYDPLNGLKSCPIWDLHYQYSYEQNKKTKVGKVLINILETLIPTKKDSTFPDECSMFLQSPPSNEVEYGKVLREANAPVFGAWQG